VDFDQLNRKIVRCKKCPRLVAWRQEIARKKKKAYRDWTYWGKPVPGFGDTHARILVVGLAPGAHGSNRTGRMFTGDASGRFLYGSLHRAGLANQPNAESRDDSLRLNNVYITASLRCVPPDNKPRPDELINCQPYLTIELDWIKPHVIVCLGRIAFSRVLGIHGLRPARFNFAHGALHRLPGRAGAAAPWLLCSYHPSQQNTQTGRLTASMFDAIWTKAGELLHDA
jgi:uracil-DNA glycosylase family 4